jgi:hypothetical protein
MAKILAISFGAALILFGLAAFASPTVFGAHNSPLANLLKLLAGGGMVYAARKAGASVLFGCCVAAGAAYLLGGLAGFIFGQPAESTLQAMPPDVKLMVVIPGFLEAGRSDHLLHVGIGVAFAVAAVVSVAETPFRLRK